MRSKGKSFRKAVGPEPTAGATVTRELLPSAALRVGLFRRLGGDLLHLMILRVAHHSEMYAPVPPHHQCLPFPPLPLPPTRSCQGYMVAESPGVCAGPSASRVHIHPNLKPGEVQGEERHEGGLAF